jgi:SAM-dependent methyltransferase
MPSFNESRTLEEVIRRVLASRFTAELIIVDDGSTDGSLGIAEQIQDTRVRLIVQPFNQGKGAALRKGFAAATADYVIVQDADLEYDPADYEKVLAPLMADRADVVYGSRFHTSQAHRVLYFWHSVGNRALTTASNMFTNLNLTDVETCYKAFRREVIQGIVIEEDRFGFEPEITAKVARGGWRIYEVGISYAGRTYAQGKKIGWKDGVRAMRCIVRYSAPRERLRQHLTGLTGVRRPASFAEAEPELAETLETLDGATNYSRWIYGLMEPHLGEEVLEVGAGYGTITEMLASRKRVVATDPSGRCVERLRDRFSDRPDVEILEADVAKATTTGTYDSIVAINVLEHIEDDGTAIKQMATALKPGGRLLLWVPALDGLYSNFDRKIGHFRRYDIDCLSSRMHDAGLDVIDCHYVNPVGAVAWWTLVRLLRRSPTTAGSAKIFDRFVPVLRRIEREHSMSFGQSIFCAVAQPSTS